MYPQAHGLTGTYGLPPYVRSPPCGTHGHTAPMVGQEVSRLRNSRCSTRHRPRRPPPAACRSDGASPRSGRIPASRPAGLAAGPSPVSSDFPAVNEGRAGRQVSESGRSPRADQRRPAAGHWRPGRPATGPDDRIFESDAKAGRGGAWYPLEDEAGGGRGREGVDVSGRDGARE